MRFMGVLALMMAAFLTVYLVWALFFDSNPKRENNNFLSPIILIFMMITVGLKWVKGEKVE